jgi:hypothetical protein
MDSSQIVTNVLVAGAAASLLLGAIDPVQALLTRRVTVGAAGLRDSPGAFRILQVVIGVTAAVDWILALILIGGIPQPLFDGRLLENHVAGWLILPLLATAVWLQALSRPERSLSARIALLTLVLTFVPALLFAVGLAVQIAFS